VYEILERIKIGPNRIRMYNLSAGEGSKFAAFANEFVDQIREIGPSPINLVRAGNHAVTVKEAT
jgi:coenzyme F420-reducing hydrogenase delta subunit